MSTELPLKGLRVLDLANFVAAPVACAVLADYGAEVIKIEAPGEGDPQRKLGQSSSYPQHSVNYCWHLVNRNKQSIVLDLKHVDGRAVFDQLVRSADIVVVNFTPSVRERLRVRYADLASLNKRIIYASLTGYGETGPDADLPGFDTTAFFARSGMLDALAYDGGPPAFPAPAQGDMATGMNLVAAIVMAVLHRERTGEGSEVSTSLLASGLWSNAILAQGALLGSFLTPRPPPSRPLNALSNLYRTADNRWLQLVIAREDRLWPELCRALERADILHDPRFETKEARRRNVIQLAALLEQAFGAKPWSHWRARLRECGITFGLIKAMHEIPQDEQLEANGAIVPASVAGMAKTVSAPIRLSFASEPLEAGAGPSLGGHTRTLLKRLGHADEDIERLRASGAVG